MVTLPFPVKEGDYDSDWEILQGLEVGEAGARDCCIREIEGSVPVLKQLEGICVAFDELRWLGVQLDAFDKYELAAYQATMSKGIRYHKNDVVIEFFKDAACTDKKVFSVSLVLVGGLLTK